MRSTLSNARLDDIEASQVRARLAAGQRLAVGIDTVEVQTLRASLASHGARFERRFFTAGELNDARSVAGAYAERLAARFAAKEAAQKAFGLCEQGIDWREIEVERSPSGKPRLRLHGSVACHVEAFGFGAIDVSLSHDGQQACAVVVALVTDRDDASDATAH